ncbi:MAG TPA: conjugal transfer protein TrbF [Tepidisphaeraceae bacterium]|nr:conjugal transfer protein TrbF [Tepidisphaeraceae bacterium]
MSFGKRTTSYGSTATAPIETPYTLAAGEWDNRIGSARVQARNWRYIAFAAMTGMLMLAVGLIHLADKKQVATYVVEVDSLGRPGRITLASDAYQPTAAQTGYFVGELVRLVRERPLDPVVMRKQWTKAYGFLADDAIPAMNQYAASDTGMDALGNRLARTVEVGSVLQRSKDSYQVRWIETTYANGMRKSTDQYTGLFNVVLSPPKTEEEAFRNPIGLYVTNFTWSREFSGPIQNASDASKAPQRPAPKSNRQPTTLNSR